MVPARDARRRNVGKVLLGLAVVALAACGGGGGTAVPKVALEPVASGMQASLNGFSFPNFPSSTYPDSFDTNDIVNMFGNDASVCTTAAANPCTLTAEAAAFARMVNQARATGHCEGLVALALSRFDTKENPQTVELPAQGDVIHAIMRAFATQFIPEVQSEVKGWMNKSLSDKVSALTASLKLGKLDYTLGVYTPNGGHALLPYAIEYPSKDIARIMVYDSNWPAKNRWVDVDLAAKTWSFSFSGQDPNNDPAKWSGGPKDMDLTSFEKRQGTCPFCGDGTTVSKNSLLVAKNTIVLRSENLDWSVDVNGKKVSPQQPDAASEDGVVVAPVKGAGDRSAFDYVIQIPADPTKTGGGTATKLTFSGSTSMFAMTPTGIAQVTTPGNAGVPVELGANSIVSNDPNVNLTLASGNLVATASGPSATLEVKGETMSASVQSTNGQTVTQEVTPTNPAASVVADSKSGGVTVLAQSTSGEVVKRDVAPDGTETKSVTTATLNLNSTAFEAPKGLESKPVDILPPITARNLANPDYKPDAAYVPPTTVPADGKTSSQAIAATKTVLGKWTLSDRTVGEAPFTITPPASNSDGQFMYASSDPKVATVSPTGKVTIVGPGSTAITVTQSATQEFSQASVTAVMMVTKGTPKLATVAGITKKFGDDPFQVSPPESQSDAEFTFTSSDPKVATVTSSGRVTIVGVGSVTITMSQAATDTWEAASRRLVVVVSRRTPALGVLTVANKTFGDPDFTVAAPTSNSSGTWAFSSNDTNVISIDAVSGVASVKGAGTVSIRAAQAPTVTDEAASESITVTVAKAAPAYGSFVLKDLETTVTSAQSVTAPRSSSPQPFVFASSDTSVATIDNATGRITVVGAGTSIISASQSETANFKSGAVSATLTVTKGLPTIGNLTVGDRVYGSADFTVAAPTSNSDGVFTFTSSDTSVATVAAKTGVVRIVAPGTTSIRATQASTAKYASSSVSTSLTVAKGVPTLGPFADWAKTWGDPEFTVTAPTSNSDGAFTFSSSNTGVVSVGATTGVVSIKGAGTATLTASQATTTYWTAVSKSLTVSVAKAAQYPLSITSLSGTSGATNPLTLVTSGGSGSGAVSYVVSTPVSATGNAGCTVSGSLLTATSAGTCIVTATKDGDSNYLAVSTAATTITFVSGAQQAPATTVPVSPACASTVTSDQGYTVEKFTSTGTCSWSVPGGVTTADVLVVAGGGGGGGDAAGGGGAGGVVYNQGSTVSGTVSVTVGNGGVGGIGQTATVSTNGGNSAFGNISAAGGGAGGRYNAQAGASGGSGGGGAYAGGAGGSGTTNQGYSGGTGSTAQSGGAGGGGGGAGGTGSTGSNGDAAGGAGVVNSITGTATWYAGGGGGGRWNVVSTIENGGMGGGGRGAGSCSTDPATAGVANTGGGGGGAPANCQTQGAAGGTGVVIVRYLTPCAVNPVSLGTETVVKFTASGTCGWQVPAGVSTVRVLTVGGGGGGGADNGGGGGAGGFIDTPAHTVTAGSVMKVTVGAGGAGATVTTNAGATGDASVFGSITAHGGGGGGSIDMSSGLTGASSGGRAANRSGSAGTGMSAGYPNEGQAGGGTNGWGGGGGGGATTAGSDGGAGNGGAGGAGMSSDITGVNAYYAGGGGGGGNGGSAMGGNGGNGGGGDGSATGSAAPTAGTPNTGGGGGGAGGGVAGGIGAAGGSGFVVVRYTPPCAPTLSVSGTYTIAKFTLTGTCKWVVPAGATSVEYLIVAGGGGGASGGGGGGGVLTNLGGTKVGLTVGTQVTVTVGAGGGAGTGYSTGAKGLNSVFNGITALGGGGGGGDFSNGPTDGGSGGGGGYDQTAITRTTGTTGQGYGGGLSGFPGYGGGGGGGGAGGAGSDALAQFNGGNGGRGGAGGIGVSNSITGAAAYYGGGGGGGINANDGVDYPNLVASGGLGGGGNGSTIGFNGGSPANNGTPGIANTGGGGGGTDPGSPDGNAGGSGIIIVRYTTP